MFTNEVDALNFLCDQSVINVWNLQVVVVLLSIAMGLFLLRIWVLRSLI